MENSETNGEILQNVVISEAASDAQFMIQRLPENSPLLESELLEHHNGLVVDLAETDFIPVPYNSETLLTHDLTEEDRNLAAALVAVQFSQHQKQQHVQGTNLQSLVQNAAIGNYLCIHNIYSLQKYLIGIIEVSLYTKKLFTIQKIIT